MTEINNVVFKVLEGKFEYTIQYLGKILVNVGRAKIKLFSDL